MVTALASERATTAGSADGAAAFERRPTTLVDKHLSLMTGVYLYFIGWNFSYYYYDYFGISFHALGIPFYSVFIFALTALNYRFNLLWFPLLLLACFGLYTRMKRTRPELVEPVMIGVLLLLFPAFFAMAQYSGRSLAARRITNDMLKPVMVETSVSTMPPGFVMANSEGRLRYLGENTDRYYIVEISKAAHAFSIYHLDKRDVRFAAITRQVD
jgi:hypothetical protein